MLLLSFPPFQPLNFSSLISLPLFQCVCLFLSVIGLFLSYSAQKTIILPFYLGSYSENRTLTPLDRSDRGQEQNFFFAFFVLCFTGQRTSMSQSIFLCVYFYGETLTLEKKHIFICIQVQLGGGDKGKKIEWKVNLQTIQRHFGRWAWCSLVDSITKSGSAAFLHTADSGGAEQCIRCCSLFITPVSFCHFYALLSIYLFQLLIFSSSVVFRVLDMIFCAFVCFCQKSLSSGYLILLYVR